MLRFIAPIAFFLLAGIYLSAQQMNEPGSPCAGIAITSDLVSCLWKAKASSEAEMSSQYDEIKKRLDEDEIEQMAEAQDFWLKYREANCSAEKSLYKNGTAAQPTYLACVEAMTRRRAKELRVSYAVRLK